MTLRMALLLSAILSAETARGQSVLIEEWKGRTFCPHSATFTPDGAHLLLSGEWTGDAGGAQPELKIWDIKQQQYVGEHRIDGRGLIQGLDVAPDGSTLMVATAGPGRRVNHNGHTRLIGPNDVWLWNWDMRSRRPRGRPQSALTPVRRILAAEWTTFGEYGTRIWDNVLFSPDGEVCAVHRIENAPLDDGSGQYHYSEIDILEPSGQLVATIVPPNDDRGATRGMAFSGDGTQLITSTLREPPPYSPGTILEVTVRRWNIENGEEVAKNSVTDTTRWPERTWNLSGGRDSLAVSSDGSRIASAGADFAIQIWNAQTLTPETPLVGLEHGVGALAFSPDGKFLAATTVWSGLRRNQFLVWEVATGEIRCCFAEDYPHIRALEFSPDGRWLLTRGDTPPAGGVEVRLWDFEKLIAK